MHAPAAARRLPTVPGLWLAGAAALLALGLIAWEATAPARPMSADREAIVPITADLQRRAAVLIPVVLDPAADATTEPEARLAAEAAALRDGLHALEDLTSGGRSASLDRALASATTAAESAIDTVGGYLAGEAPTVDLVRAGADLPAAMAALHEEADAYVAAEGGIGAARAWTLGAAGVALLGLLLAAGWSLTRTRSRERRASVLLQALLDQTSSGIVIVDRAGRLRFMNRGMEVLLGQTIDELGPEGLWDLIAPADVMRIRARAEHGHPSAPGTSDAPGDDAPPEVITATHRDGALRRLELGTTAAITLGGERLFVGALRDVTAEMTARNEREQMDAWMETILLGAPVTLWAIDARGRYTFAVGKDSAATFTRRVPHELVGQNIRDIYTDAPDVVAQHEQALAGVETRATVRVGGRAFDTVLSPLHGPDGTVRGVVGVATDVTERLRAQEAQRRVEGRYRTVFESSTYGLAFLDLDGHFQLANQRMADLLQIPPDDLPTRWAGEWVAGGALADISREVATMLRHPQDHPDPVRYQRRLERPHGGAVELEGIISIVGEAGVPTGLLVEARDVTQELRLREQLTRSEKAEALGRMVAGIAHDFNNLLTIIGGAVDQEMSRTGDSYWMQTARQATDRAGDLVRGLLQFARSERPERTAERLDVLVQRTIALAERMLDPRVALEVWVEPDLPPAEVDRTQIGQVLMNLLVNARDAVVAAAEAADAPTGYRPTIRVQLRRAGEDVEIAIADNGVGMTADVRDRIFDPFFTTKGSGRGIGLGLATSYGIVQAHGGAVGVDSAPGTGTTFTIRLPLKTRPTFTAAVPELPRSRAQRARLLLVDDERHILELNRMILTDAGFWVRTVDNGYEAVREAQHDPPDAVVLDVSMPGVDGWETLVMLRRVRPDLPVIVSTGYATAEEATARGANHLLAKPYRPADLVAAVEAVLGAQVLAASTASGDPVAVEPSTPPHPVERA